jgi:glycosyltransferase involved in cell wall biosynthesis
LKITMFGLKGIPYTAGIETVVEELGSRLAKRGHEVVVYVRPHHTPPEQKYNRGMRLVHLPSIPTKNLDTITHSCAAWLPSLRWLKNRILFSSIAPAIRFLLYCPDYLAFPAWYKVMGWIGSVPNGANLHRLILSLRITARFAFLMQPPSSAIN